MQGVPDELYQVDQCHQHNIDVTSSVSAVFVTASAGVRISSCLRPDGHTAFDREGRLVMERKTTAS